MMNNELLLIPVPDEEDDDEEDDHEDDKEDDEEADVKTGERPSNRIFFPALRRNNPNATEIPAVSIHNAYPQQYRRYIESETIEKLEALFDAVRRNDPDTTEIPVVSRHNAYPQQYGRHLGEALQENHYVSSMQLRLDCLLDANEEEGNTESIVLLLRYIRESMAMRRVALFDYNRRHTEDTKKALLGRILLEIAQNPWVEELTLNDIKMKASSESFAQFLQTTRSLKRLKIKLGGFDEPALSTLVTEAFVVNQSLESLTFESNSDAEFVKSVLLRQGSLQSLRFLDLNCGDSVSELQFHTLASYLPSARLLEHLSLQGYAFNKEHMEHLVEGLRSNRSLIKLTLNRCSLDLEATDTFRGYMQTRDHRTAIRELCIVENGLSVMFEGASTGAMMASMLSMPDENLGMGSSIALLLQGLDLLCSDLAGFCDALATNASKIRLPCLRLCGTSNIHAGNKAGLEALNRCLPKLVYLNRLDISDMNQYVVSHTFVSALRNNGSLQHVALTDSNTTYVEDCFDEAESCIIASYCKRNEVLPKLVAEARQLVSLLPMLFQSAKQARRTAPNAILIALLDVGDGIGPTPTQHPASRRRPYNTQEAVSCVTDDNAAGDDDSLTRPNKKSYGSRKPKKRM